MNFKNLLIVVLALLVIVLGYWVGYRNGVRDNQKRALRFRLTESVLMYQAAERGDLAKLKSSLGVIVLGQSAAFRELFGDVVPGDDFASRWGEAQRISKQVASNMVVIAGPK